jgi:hypothetical protein
MPEDIKYECPICNQKQLEDDDYVEHVHEKHQPYFCFAPQLFDKMPIHLHKRITALIVGNAE